MFRRFTPLAFQVSQVLLKDIYVGNLPWSTTEQALLETFSKFGQCTGRIIIDRDTGRSRGFAFVSYVDDAAADEAIAKMNGQDFFGRTLRVNAGQRQRGPPPPRGPGGMGGAPPAGEPHGSQRPQSPQQRW